MEAANQLQGRALRRVQFGATKDKHLVNLIVKKMRSRWVNCGSEFGRQLRVVLCCKGAELNGVHNCSKFNEIPDDLALRLAEKAFMREGNWREGLTKLLPRSGRARAAMLEEGSDLAREQCLTVLKEGTQILDKTREWLMNGKGTSSKVADTAAKHMDEVCAGGGGEVAAKHANKYAGLFDGLIDITKQANADGDGNGDAGSEGSEHTNGHDNDDDVKTQLSAYEDDEETED
eukprot:jgi/Mesen1/10555/ME000831S10061